MNKQIEWQHIFWFALHFRVKCNRRNQHWIKSMTTTKTEQQKIEINGPLLHRGINNKKKHNRTRYPDSLILLRFASIRFECLFICTHRRLAEYHTAQYRSHTHIHVQHTMEMETDRIAENLPRFICFVERLRRQHPIIKILISTNDAPHVMPTMSSVPDSMLPTGVVLVVGKPPRDEAGWPVGGASNFDSF